MRLIQLTDLHLPSSPDEVVYGVRIHQVLRPILNKLQRQPPDALLITGDLAAKTEDEIAYHWLKVELEQFGCPWRVLKGNHDRGELAEKVFGSQVVNGFQIWTLSAAISLILLDTSPEAVPQSVLHELADYLRQCHTPQYCFTHYPPLPVGHPMFDTTEALQWREDLRNVLSQSPVPIHVFCGHTHFAQEGEEGPIRYYTTPSATLPTLAERQEFVLDPKGAYAREIAITSGGYETALLYRAPADYFPSSG